MSEPNIEIESKLTNWLSQCERVSSQGDCEIDPMSGDAGNRQYFKLKNHPDLLAVYAPPEKLNSQHFVNLADFLHHEGIHAPQIYEFDRDRGFLLIENFGDELFLSVLNDETVESLYGEALLTLLRMQQAPSNLDLLSPYDGKKLREELDVFPHWFAERLLGHVIIDSEKELIDRVFQQLVDKALEQPQVFVHRDFHSRNLVHRQVGPPGVIDFQDAVWGPITYDLVSLLKDCYVRWPRERVYRWAQAYASMVTSAGLMQPISAGQFQQWFDWMGLQRHLKVLGVFARLFLRDNKSGYLSDLPLVMRYTLETLDDYAELKPLSHWFKETLLPLCEQQSWYEDYRTAGYCPMANGDG